MFEAWLPLRGYEGLYMISNLGKIYHIKRKRLLKFSLRGGYNRVCLFNDKKVKKQKSVHRLVAEVYCDGYNPMYDVNHIDGNKLNNHYSNLEWVTRSQNCQHSYDNGLSKKRIGHTDTIGTKNAMAKLNEQIVCDIRRLYESKNFTYQQLADMFYVNQTTIYYIIQRKTWKHVK